MRVLKIFSLLFGVGFIASGIMGYVPALAPDGNLLGLFEIDGTHNIIHIVSGVIALLAASSAVLAKWCFRIFGLVYGAVTIAGFALGGDLYIMHVNMADNVLHLVIAVVALYLGFIFRSARS